MRSVLTVISILFFFCSYTQENRNTLIIYFNTNDFKLSEYSKKQLESVFELAVQQEFFIERIIGYTDTNGSNESNKILAANRIKSVENFISTYNFNIIEKIVSGEDYPNDAIKLNDHAYWRRVEIVYLIAPSVRVDEKEVQSSFPSEIDIESIGKKNQEPIVLNIQFVPGEDILIGNSYDEIMKMQSFLRENVQVKAFIRGHVCCDYDLDLSAARAGVVFDILLNHGIPPSRVSYKGFSNTIPAVSPEITDEDRQMNRRVDVIFSLTNE